MADRYATKDGDWSDVSVWDGGVSLPSAGDTVRPNGFDVVIDQSITVGILTNNASGAAAANGTFTLADGITVNADIEGRASPNADFVISGAGDQSVVGNVTAFFGSGWAVAKNTSGLLSITGNLTCGGSNTAHAVILSGIASLSVVGDLDNDGLSTIGNSSSVYTTSSGAIDITGNVTGASAIIFAIRPGVYSTGSGNITVTGTVRGGVAGVYSFGIYCTGAVTVVHNGDAICGAGSAAVALTNTSSTYVHNGNAQSNSTGRQALDVRGYYLINQTSPMTHTYRTNNSGIAGDERKLYTLNALPVDYAPAEADVRKDTVYNNGESTGSLVVPAAESVSYGVPVDDTVGSALLTADSLIGVLAPAGSGARTITVHVTNASGGADLDGCSVTIKDSANFVKGKVEATDVNGEGEVYVDDGPYTVIVSRDGFITKGQAVTVSGDATVEVELTAHVTAASAVGRVTGYGYTDIDGVVTASTPATLTGVGRPTSGSTSTGLLSNYNATNSSDSNGKVSFTNLIPGASYLLAYAGKTKKWDIPADATGEVAMDTIVGDGT